LQVLKFNLESSFTWRYPSSTVTRRQVSSGVTWSHP